MAGDRTTPKTPGVFDLELVGDTIVVTPTADLRELAFPAVEAGAREVLSLLARTPVRNAVVDLSRTGYFGSTAIGFFARLGSEVRQRSGRMAFCNASEIEKDILKVAHLGGIGPICPSRELALAAVAASPTADGGCST